MESKRTYMNLGFLDFLAYYVPGIFVILFLVTIDCIIVQIDFEKVIQGINSISNDAYVRGAIWTILSLVIPYVIGHIIFPVDIKMGKYFLKKYTYEKKEIIKNCYCEGEQFCKM